MGHYREEAAAKLDEAVADLLNGNAVVYAERAIHEALNLIRLVDLEESEPTPSPSSAGKDPAKSEAGSLEPSHTGGGPA